VRFYVNNTQANINCFDNIKYFLAERLHLRGGGILQFVDEILVYLHPRNLVKSWGKKKRYTE